jgi:hypothetical protein
MTLFGTRTILDGYKCGAFAKLFSNNKCNMNANNNIIGYIHICQKPGWQQIYDILFNKIKTSGLYDNTREIRLSVLSDNNEYVDDIRLHDPKIVIVYKGRSEEYERPTLLQIKAQCEIDPPNTLYYYLHTKGLSHLGKDTEPNVLDWIHLMLYWNIERWENAISIVTQDCYWTYGCNHTGIHYSGNFWWSKPSHIKRLSDYIPDYYTAPEDWVTMLYYGQYKVPIHAEYYSAFNSGLEGMGHYSNSYPESKYVTR